MILPTHKCGLYLEHNAHKDYYETAIESIVENHNNPCPYQWKNDEHKNRSMDTNEVWTLQWYPRTPIGFHLIAAPTLSELLEFALEVESEERGFYNDYSQRES